MTSRTNSAWTHRSACRAVLPLVLCALAHLHGVAWGAPASPPVSPPPSGARGSLIGPYLGAPFELTRNDYNFGQAPAWTTGDRVLSHELDSAGVRQVYRARLDGSAQECLTCNTVAGPNGFPQDRPQSDWILFQSYGQQPVHTGGPGFGGYGGDLYVMRPGRLATLPPHDQLRSRLRPGVHRRRAGFPTTTSTPSGRRTASRSSGRTPRLIRSLPVARPGRCCSATSWSRAACRR